MVNRDGSPPPGRRPTGLGVYLRKIDLAVLFVAVEHAIQQTKAAQKLGEPSTIAVAGEAITLGFMFGTPRLKGKDGRLNEFLRERCFPEVEHPMIAARSFERLTNAGLLYRIVRSQSDDKKKPTFQYGITSRGKLLFNALVRQPFDEWPDTVDWTGDPSAALLSNN